MSEEAPGQQKSAAVRRWRMRITTSSLPPCRKRRRAAASLRNMLAAAGQRNPKPASPPSNACKRHIRQGGASERIDLLLEMADMAQTIVRMRAEILAIKPPSGGPFDAVEELDSIVQTTESATSQHSHRRRTGAGDRLDHARERFESKRLRRTRCAGDRNLYRLFLSGSHGPAHAQGDPAVALPGGSDQYVVNARGKTPAAMTMAAEPSLTSSSLVQAGVDAVMGQPTRGKRTDRTLRSRISAA